MSHFKGSSKLGMKCRSLGGEWKMLVLPKEINFYKPISITMDRYGHLLKKADERMRSALEELQAQLK